MIQGLGSIFSKPGLDSDCETKLTRSIYLLLLFILLFFETSLISLYLYIVFCLVSFFASLLAFVSFLLLCLLKTALSKSSQIH